MKSRRTSINVLVVRPLLRLAFAENSGLASLGFRHPDADMAQSAQTTWGTVENHWMEVEIKRVRAVE